VGEGMLSIIRRQRVHDDFEKNSRNIFVASGKNRTYTLFGRKRKNSDNDIKTTHVAGCALGRVQEDFARKCWDLRMTNLRDVSLTVIGIVLEQ
jgi:hypothetical protein